MYAAAKIYKARFLWRVWEFDYECSGEYPRTSITHLRLEWGKNTREWKVSVEQQGPNWSYVAIRFYRVIDTKTEGWMLRGPIERII